MEARKLKEIEKESPLSDRRTQRAYRLYNTTMDKITRSTKNYQSLSDQQGRGEDSGPCPLSIILNAYISTICRRIAAERGIDALDLIFSYIRKGIYKDWNFAENKPQKKARRFSPGVLDLQNKLSRRNFL